MVVGAPLGGNRTGELRPVKVDGGTPTGRRLKPGRPHFLEPPIIPSVCSGVLHPSLGEILFPQRDSF